jgi:hypothetical protein
MRLKLISADKVIGKPGVVDNAEAYRPLRLSDDWLNVPIYRQPRKSKISTKFFCDGFKQKVALCSARVAEIEYPYITVTA